MSASPVIAVIVPVHNRISLTIPGLTCIKASIDYYINVRKFPYEIKLIVVDDGSTDGTGDWIRENQPETIVLRGDGNLWWTGSVNMGIDFFQKNFTNLAGVILQNDDIVIEKEWLLNLIVCATQHKNALIGCATASLHDSEYIYYGGIRVNPWFSSSTTKNKGYLRNQFPKGHVEESFDLYGRGIFIPMNVFTVTGLFNAKQFKHRGDMDIPLRAKKHGFRLLVSYDALVFQLPEHSYSLNVKKNLSLREAFNLLTDFRSSTNISYNFYYSLAATTNKMQFMVFFAFRTMFSIKDIISRYIVGRMAPQNKEQPKMANPVITADQQLEPARNINQ